MPSYVSRNNSLTNVPNQSSLLSALPPGTSGNILTSTGTGWASQAAPDANRLVLINSASGSNVTSVAITSGFTSTYKTYKLFLKATFNASVLIYYRFYINGAIVTSSSYATTLFYATSAGGNFLSYNTSAQPYANFNISGNVVCTELTFFDPSNADYRKAVYGVNTCSTGDDNSISHGFISNGQSTSAGQRQITGIHLETGGSAGTWSVQLYGIKE